MQYAVLPSVLCSLNQHLPGWSLMQEARVCIALSYLWLLIFWDRISLCEGGWLWFVSHLMQYYRHMPTYGWCFVSFAGGGGIMSLSMMPTIWVHMWWTYRFVPFWYYKQCCYECLCTSFCLNTFFTSFKSKPKSGIFMFPGHGILRMPFGQALDCFP